MTTEALGRSATAACNGVTVNFTVPFQFEDGALRVYLLDGATDDNEDGDLLSEGTHYTIAGSGATAGGATITTLTAYPSGKYLRRWRETSRAQIQLYTTGPFPAAPSNAALDRLAMVDEELGDDIGRVEERALRTIAGQSADPIDLDDFEGMILSVVDGQLVPVALDGEGDTAAALASLALYTGAGLVNYRHPLGTRTRSLRARAADELMLTDFCDMDGSVETTDFQEFIDKCSSDDEGDAPCGVMPAGDVTINGTIELKKKYVNVRGAGPFSTRILCDGVAGAVFQSVEQDYLKPRFSGFTVLGNAGTGIGFDFSAVQDQVFDFQLADLFIQTGATCLLAPRIFSGSIERVYGHSLAGNTFQAACGPGLTWKDVYGKQGGPDKACFRLTGIIRMEGCNGLDNGDYWGVFGQDIAASDGFQADFLDINGDPFIDYPDVQLDGCNIEHFAKCGIKMHGPWRNLDIRGGKIDRANLASAYHSLIWLTHGPVVPGNPVELDLGYVFKGAGVPNGGGALTNAWLFASAGVEPIFVDKSGAFANDGITGAYITVNAGLVPLVRESVTNDVTQDAARQFSAIAARRISARVIRYAMPAALTPAGSDQSIDVTGYTKVIVTPAAACSVSHATFTQTAGAGLDAGRNGELIIEAGNGNLTLTHNDAGAGGFRLAAGVDLVMAAGAIARFIWSTNYTPGVGGWVQA